MMVRSVANAHIVGMYYAHPLTHVSLREGTLGDPAREEELKRQGNLHHGYFIDDGVITHHFPSKHRGAVPDGLEERINNSPSHNYRIFNQDPQTVIDTEGMRTVYHSPNHRELAELYRAICGTQVIDRDHPARYDT